MDVDSSALWRFGDCLKKFSLRVWMNYSRIGGQIFKQEKTIDKILSFLLYTYVFASRNICIFKGLKLSNNPQKATNVTMFDSWKAVFIEISWMMHLKICVIETNGRNQQYSKRSVLRFFVRRESTMVKITSFNVIAASNSRHRPLDRGHSTAISVIWLFHVLFLAHFLLCSSLAEADAISSPQSDWLFCVIIAVLIKFCLLF